MRKTEEMLRCWRALLAGALLASGADVAYFASEAAPRDLVSERAPGQMRFVLTGGWSSTSAPQRIAAEPDVGGISDVGLGDRRIHTHRPRPESPLP